MKHIVSLFSANLVLFLSYVFIIGYFLLHIYISKNDIQVNWLFVPIGVNTSGRSEFLIVLYYLAISLLTILFLVHFLSQLKGNIEKETLTYSLSFGTVIFSIVLIWGIFNLELLDFDIFDYIDGKIPTQMLVAIVFGFGSTSQTIKVIFSLFILILILLKSNLQDTVTD